MTLALWHFHIEISSKCALKCPRCPRTEIPNSLVSTELNLEFFKRNFTPDFIKDNVDRITFCGDDGDPIYAHDLIPVIKYFKSIKPVSFTIITNGSYKDTKWWAELGNCLTEIDEFHFSIDGYDDASNNIYRINSNFESIINGAKVLRRVSDCHMFWSSILFKFNENHIDKMQNIAKQIGFDVFQLTYSTKFGKYNDFYPKDDPLQPDTLYEINHKAYERRLINLSHRRFKNPYIEKNKEHFSKAKVIGEVFPLCHTGLKGLYINSEGYFYPCCWVANRYEHNNIWEKRRFSLNEHYLADVVRLNFWEKDFLDSSQECIHKCDKKYQYISFNQRKYD